MSTTVETALHDALALTAEDRAALIMHLQSSFEYPRHDEVEAAWAAEVARRLEEVDNGTAKTVSLEEAIASARGRIAGVRGR